MHLASAVALQKGLAERQALDAVGIVHVMILRVRALLLPLRTLMFSGIETMRRSLYALATDRDSTLGCVRRHRTGLDRKAP
jgi:hypothetical protein